MTKEHLKDIRDLFDSHNYPEMILKWNQLMAEGYNLTRDSFNTLLFMSLESKYLEESDSLVRKFEDLQLEPDSASISLLMRYWISKGNVQKAEAILEQTKINKNLSLRAFSPLIKEYVEKGDIQKGFATLREGLSMEIIPDDNLYEILITSILGKHQHRSLFFELLLIMKDLMYAPNRTVGSLIERWFARYL